MIAIIKEVRKKILILLCIFLCTFPLAACSSTLVEPQYADDKQIVIGGWVAPPPGFINNETYKDVADSGINHIYGLYEDADDNALKALDAAQANGIKYLVRSRGLGTIQEEDFDVLDGMFDRFKDHPAFAGVMVVDEPGAAKFERLGKLHQVFQKALPDKLYYINLNPIYSSLSQRDGRTYKEYIDEYIDVVKPTFLSYDHYPLKKNVEGTYLTEDYLLNLEIVSNATKKANIPFWLFIQSIGYFTAGMENRIPNEADIRWQVYNSLAFGAQGLQYFCYWTPGDDSLASFTEAMVDKEGKKTPLYTAVQNVNKEILSFDHIYLNFENKGVMTFPEEGKPPYMYMENPLKEFKPVKKVQSEQPVVMGCFEDKDGNKAIILVNYTDPARNMSNKVQVSFDKTKALLVHDQHGKNQVKLSGGKYEVTLEPGEGQFIQLLSGK